MWDDDPDEPGSYADPDATFEHNDTVEWNHGIGAIVTALADGGPAGRVAGRAPDAVHAAVAVPGGARPPGLAQPAGPAADPAQLQPDRGEAGGPSDLLGSAAVPYVFSFDHKHRRAPMEMKDLLGGKGANLAEMTSVLGLPVPPGFTITTDACRAYLDGGWPDVARRRGGQGRPQGREDDGQAARRPRRSAAGQRALGGQVLDAGDDGHRPQPRAQRRVGARGSPRRPATRASPTTPTAASSPCTAASCSTSTAQRLRSAARHRQGVGRRHRRRAGSAPTTLQRLCQRYQEVVAKRRPAQPFPQDPAVQLRGAIEAVFQSWGGARAIAYRERERIPHDLGTAVNVQTMVFGNRDDQSGTGVGFTRDASTGENKPYGDFLVNAQGEDVVAGIRNTEDLDALPAHLPEDPRRAAGDLRSTRAALPRHVRHRVHDRAGQALDAPDAGRQAHRCRRAAHGRRDDQAEGLEDHAGRGHPAGGGRSPRPGAAPPVRGGRQDGDRQGPGRVARGRGRPRVLHRRRRRRRRPSAASR